MHLISSNCVIAPNTDGMDIGCSNVHIYDSFIKNGDDSYCMKSATYNVLIENSNGTQGFGAPCGTSAILHIKNMYFYKQEWAIKVKAEGSNQNGTMKEILFENIKLDNVSVPIYSNQINSHPCGTAKPRTPKPTKAPSNSLRGHGDNREEIPQVIDINIDIINDGGSSSLIVDKSHGGDDDKGLIGNIWFDNIVFRNISGTYGNCSGTLVCGV